MTRPVGYLISSYPGVSHTFIMREVQALRRAGTAVRTYSVHRSGPADVLSQNDMQEARTTTALLPVSTATVVGALLRAGLRHPGPFAGALLTGIGRGDGPRGRLWQLFYFVEAVLLWGYCRRDGVRHLHTHFANNAADIARTVTDFATRIDGPGTWSWSFTMHGPTEFVEPRRYGLSGKVRDAAFIACISRYCQDRVAAASPDRHGELVQVRCGLQLSRFPAVERHRAEGPLRVLCVGRLVPEKGQDLLVSAVADLVRVGTPVELVLVGAGPLRPALEAQVERLGLGGSVTLTGAVGQDDILGWYAWADVFALLSYAEGLPVVLMEAMATGLPVLTTRIAGIPELVQDACSGWVIEPGDVPAAAAALQAMAADRRAASALGARARERVLAQHDVDACILPLQQAFRRWARP